MKYIKEATVLYQDTDSYKVVWHGNYLRWLEEGRFSICKMIGADIPQLDEQGITFPIVDMHIRYKAPAKIFEDIIIETKVADVKTRTVTFYQTIKNKKSGATLVTAEFICVAVSAFEAKLQKMPIEVYNAFKKAIEQ